MSIVKTVTPVSHDLGGFTVRRAVPLQRRHRVRVLVVPQHQQRQREPHEPPPTRRRGRAPQQVGRHASGVA